jgi:hypothetical protein
LTSHLDDKGGFGRQKNKLGHMVATLNLLVLRADKPEALVPFYEALGVRFDIERHGKGPEHYSGRCGDALLEIYPMLGGGSTVATRLGFVVDDVAQACLVAGAFGSILKEPSETEWGVRAVLADPIGHKVELIQKL